MDLLQKSLSQIEAEFEAAAGRLHDMKERFEPSVVFSMALDPDKRAEAQTRYERMTPPQKQLFRDALLAVSRWVGDVEVEDMAV